MQTASISRRIRRYGAAMGMAAAVTLTAVLVTPVLVTSAQADVNGINRFKVRNCTPVKMMVCAYDKGDNILAIPYHSSTINPGGTNKYSCGSANRCKVFTGVSDKDVDKLLNSAAVSAVAMGAAGGGGMVGMAGGTMFLYSAIGSTAAIGSAGGAVLGAGVAVGAVVAVAATIDGVNAGKACKSMFKDQKKMINAIIDDVTRQKAKDAMDKNWKGRWPEYKEYSLTNSNGYLEIEEGFKCN